MKTPYLLMASLLSAVLAQANTIRVYQTDHDPAFEEQSFTYTAADLVGQFESNMLDFTDWHPYGLDHSAVEITGTVYSNAPTNAYFIGCVDSNGWYNFAIGGWAYQTYFDFDSSGNIQENSCCIVGEIEYTPGPNAFSLTYQTSPYDYCVNWGEPMVGPTFHSDLPYSGWGGDPRAIGYKVGVTMPDEAGTATLLLVALATIAGVTRMRRLWSGAALSH